MPAGIIMKRPDVASRLSTALLADSKEDAKQLYELIHGINCHVNLIPVNPVKERSYVQSERKVIVEFKNKLENCGINVTIRREMGRDIGGACGQLRKSYMDKEKKE